MLTDAEHAKYRAMLERHLDGELGAEQRVLLLEHLEHCQECSEILEAEQRLVDNLSRLPRLIAPSDLRARIIATAEAEHQERVPLTQDKRFASALRGPDDEDEEEFHFAGTHRARPSALRVMWRRYSPVAAMVFLAVAAVGALLTSQPSSFPLVASAQNSARAIVVAVTGVNLSGTPASTRLPSAVPLPAEHEKATIAALVLKCTDKGVGIEQDKIEATIRALAEQAPGGLPGRNDQFVCDGRRFKCYTVSAADAWVGGVAQELKAYRASPEDPVLSTLNELDEPLPAADSVAVFSAPGEVIRKALSSSDAGAAGPTVREVRIVLVE